MDRILFVVPPIEKTRRLENIRCRQDPIYRANEQKLCRFIWSSNDLIMFSVLSRLLGQPQPKTLYFLVDAKSRVREVYTQTCLHFATQGMQDTELFGLAVLIGELQIA